MFRRISGEGVVPMELMKGGDAMGVVEVSVGFNRSPVMERRIPATG